MASLVDAVVQGHGVSRPKKAHAEIVLVDVVKVEFRMLAGLQLADVRHGKGIDLLKLSN
jgi:hypothetical protein